MRKEYEEIDGKKYAILWRKKGNKSTDKCPFCGDNHIHGKGEGHRLPHCVFSIDKRGNPRPCKSFYTTDETYLAKEDGYILLEY